MKTARFTEVVAAAGPPQVHALWIAPGRDAALKRAVKECRVMTVHQVLRGTRKDYGTVGLQADESSQVLVFPKSLRRFGDARIVGIDYKLIVQPDPPEPAPAPAPPRKPASKAGTRKAAAKVSEGSPRSTRADRVRRAGSTAKPPQTPPPVLSREQLLAEIRRAVRELKAGKAVAAYERLSALER